MRACFSSRTACFLFVFAVGIVIVCFTAVATSAPRPIFKPTLAITSTASAPNIDGQLNDPCWQTATRTDNFVERNPGDNLVPDVPTQVYSTYDSRNLYVAFVCHDNPATIRATMSQRDQYQGDDAVFVLIDPYASASWAYELAVNAYGIQKDLLWTPIVGEDATYDLIWESAAVVTDSGYQVEIAVPFATLRFPNSDTQNWRVDFWRVRPRENYKQYSWAANDRNEQCFPCQFGTLTGITGVHPGQGLQIMPTFVAHQTGQITDQQNPRSAFRNGDPSGELSLGGKYAVNSDVTIEGALNPDFSQIEADAAQIDVNSTISLMYPERRPFFQEGSDIFRTLFNSFYTRTINDPQFATKLTGRMGKTSIGFLGARDLNTPYMIPLDEASVLLNTGKSTANIVRASRAFGSDSRLGVLFSDRRFEHGGSGSVAALDGDIRLSKNYSIDGQYILTHTAEPNDSAATAGFQGFTFDDSKHTIAFDGEKYYGTAIITRLKREARSWGFVIDYNQVNPSYRTEIGYDPLMNYRNLSLATYYTVYPKTGIFDRITPQFYSAQRWRFNGERRSQNLNAGIEGQMKIAQTYVGANFSRNVELFRGTEFRDLWQLNFNWNSRLSNKIGLGANIERGVGIARFAMTKGNQLSYSAFVDLKPIDRLIIQPNIAFARSRDLVTDQEYYSGYITRTRILYQASRQLSFRMVVQYDDFSRAWEIDPLMTYRLSPFSVFYLGSSSDYSNIPAAGSSPSEWRLASRQFFLKLQYLFQT